MLGSIALKAGPTRSLLRASVGLKSLTNPKHVASMSPIAVLKPSIQRSSIRFSSQSTNSASSEASSVVSSIQDKLPAFDSSAVSEATNMTSDQLGYLNSIGMAQGWGVTAWMETLLENVHVYTGLPWWGTIVTTALLIRTVLFPLYVKAAVNNARLAAIQPEMSKIMDRLKTEPENTAQITRERALLFQKNDVSVFKSLYGMAQLPFAYGVFQGLRKMAAHPVEGFSTQGALWFHDLTQVDPYLGLQGLSALLVVGLIRLGGDAGTNMNQMMKKYFYVFPAMAFVFTMNFSAAVALYISVGTFFSVLQGQLFKSQAFKNYYNLPKPPKQDLSKQPANLSEWFQQMAEKQRDSTRAKLEQANKKYEAQSRHRLHGKDGFVKRH
ncbi:uncharacterized protein CXQ87_005182 [Candidozyma duobushaemuli]|uniref:Membrane insertase YidC/Oxa/ALB C-terminal domain-containing protein n=2 Tax=Candidozyma TaxID=3303203 RepID=A0ABX8IEL0_9ASCO|nr:uncharacterized protein CXQ87_005182 [[Candida] duobushaemulonis]PVH14906.1 hypothetical protein CXQ87_005182 [[Candida] duobushaemulonis]QWU90013.1 hypothetical protein CA3LBN_004371 [[Candida] haemuloni]